jgi:hypothetical protein
MADLRLSLGDAAFVAIWETSQRCHLDDVVATATGIAPPATARPLTTAWAIS